MWFSNSVQIFIILFIILSSNLVNNAIQRILICLTYANSYVRFYRDSVHFLNYNSILISGYIKRSKLAMVN